MIRKLEKGGIHFAGVVCRVSELIVVHRLFLYIILLQPIKLTARGDRIKAPSSRSLTIGKYRGPDVTESQANGFKLAPEASVMRRTRTRPNPFGSCTPIAITTIDFRAAPRPNYDCSSVRYSVRPAKWIPPFEN